MDKVKAQFVAATEMAARAGADMIEMHAAHGYLLGHLHQPDHQPRAPMTTAAALENRMRYPLEVFTAMRAAWPGAQSRCRCASRRMTGSTAA